MRLKDVVRIKPITRVIDFQSKDRDLINGYVVMEETARHFVDILEGFTNQRDEKTTDSIGSIIPGKVNRCNKITGTYGVGKSYFLLMFKTMLEALEDQTLFDKVYDKFESFKSIQYHLNILQRQGKKYIIVNINGKNFAELDFKSVIEREVYSELVDRIGKDNLHFNNFFQKSAKQLKAWRSGDRGIYNAFENNFKEKTDFTYEEIIQGLTNRDSDARLAYIKTYKDLIGQEPGDSFETLREFIEEASENVKNNGFDGIVVLFDEFSTYLLGRGEKGLLNIDLGSIDILSESTIPSELNQIFFITTEHEDIEKILQKNIGDLSTVTKTSGRFKNFSLYFEKGASLIEGVIDKKTEEFNKIKFKFINTFDEYSNINNYADLKNIYPINPFTLEYLVKISEKYAQGDRTLFTFVDDNLRRYIEQNNIINNVGKLNLLGIDIIMDCFQDTILKDREEFAKAYNTQMERAKNNIEERIVRALALDYAVTITKTGKIKSGVNDDNIKYLLSLSDDESKEVRNFLSKEINDSQSYIIFNNGTNGYELSPDTSAIDIEEEISNALIHTNEKRFLENLILERSTALDIRKEYIIPKRSSLFPFNRTIEGEFIGGPGELKVLDVDVEIQKISNDGKIFFYVPSAGQSYDFNTILNVANEKAKEFIDQKIIIAIPKEFTFGSHDVSLLKRYEAVGRLTKDENIMNNLKTQNKLRLEIVRLRNEIYNKLSLFGRSENFIFIQKDLVFENVKSITGMIEEWLVERLYPKFPTVEVEDFSRNGGNQIIQNLIVPRKAENVDLDSSKVYAKQIKMALKPLDLVDITSTVHGHRVEIKYPADNIKAKEIFNIFQIPEGDKTIEEKFNILSSPPYGLNEAMFEVLFSLFLNTSDKYFLEDKDGKRIEVTTENMNSLWKSNYILKVTEDGVALNFKEDVINILEIIDKAYSKNFRYRDLKPNMPSDDFAKTKNLDIITSYMMTFKQNLNMFTNNLENIDVDSFMLEKIDRVVKHIEKIERTIKPCELIREISNIINIHFDNGIIIDETKEINISRYKKLQNLIDNTKWLNTNKSIIVDLKKKSNYLQVLTRDVDYTNLNQLVKRSETMIEELLKNKLPIDNWKEIKYEESIDLKGIKDIINSAIGEYNDKYILGHDNLNMEKAGMVQIVEECEHLPLIRVMEKINFQGITKLGDIEKITKESAICKYALTEQNKHFLKCPNCGKLDKLLKKKQEVEKEKTDLTRKLENMVNNYIDRIEDLMEANVVKTIYGKNEILLDFIDKNDPGYSSSVRELMIMLREDWLNNSSRIIRLINELNPIINRYIKYEETQDLKRIGYRKVISRISDRIKLSGYKKMSINDLEKEILRQISYIREEYDEITIEE